MKKTLYSLFVLLSVFTTITVLQTSCKSHQPGIENKEEDENDEYDGPDKAMELEFNKTKDPALGYVPTHRLLNALNATLENRRDQAPQRISSLNWQERGPNTDVTGPSNGNTRANGGVTSGRIRAVMVDSSDASHKTVFVAGVDGGLWKTTDITTTPSNWNVVNDYFDNLAITSLTQDPTNNNIMYFCTGEAFNNADAVRGVGVFKSTDGGNTWNFLPSTASYLFCTKIMCDYQGNVFLATRGSGLVRSTNGGSSWTNITPIDAGVRISDIEISTNNNRLYISSGIFTASLFRYTDNAATVTSTGWTSPVTPYPSYNSRCEIAAMGNTLYALPSNTSYQVPTIYKSTDGGANWEATGGQPANNWASAQAWYALSLGINPANTDEVIVGGLDTHRSLDGGASWTKISSWVGTTGQYVHADQHNLQWYDGGNKLIFACDGGIHYTADKGNTIRDRNTGLRIKQFYSVAMHPTLPNYFLAGAQDNGTHQLNSPGLSGSVEVTGGDGAFVAIDQDQPQYQFGAYVYNQYRRSTNGGANWSSVNFSTSDGLFINPFDYDNLGKKLYASFIVGQYLRWNNPQTGNDSSNISITAFNNSRVSAVTVSPFTANRVYFGTTGGRIVKVDNADGAAPADVNLTGTGMGGNLNNIAVGSSDQYLTVCYTNYGVNNIWTSTNGGSTWTAVDGNLPDMPVRWAVYNPDDNSKMFIATETGVWQTDLLNGTSTVWISDASFPTVRTDMIRYRPSDRTLAAGTHGRGVWSAVIPPVAGCNPAVINTQPVNTSACPGTSVSLTVAATGDAVLSYQWQVSTDNGNTYSNIPGATSATYTFPSTAGQDGYKYRVIVSNKCATSGASTVTSNAATITLLSASVSQQPVNISTCTGQNESFTAIGKGNALTYQWQVSTDGGTSYTNLSNTPPYSGVNTSTLVITNASAAMNNYRYRLQITASCGPVVTTTAAVLTVNSPAIITASPADVIACTDGNATFSVVATNATGYQWQVSTNNGTSYTNITGATASSYTITGVTDAQNGNLYRAVVTSPGTCGTVVSSPARLTVSVRPVVNLTAAPYYKLLPGLVTTLTVTSSLTSASVNYVWYRNNTILPGVTGTTYMVDITRLGDYKVKVTDAITGCNNTTSTVTITDSISTNLFIYPSPNNGNFTIAYFGDGSNGKQVVNIYDSKGAKVTSKVVAVNAGYNLIPINISPNRGGIYIVELLDGSGKRLKTGKVLVL